MKSNYAKLVTVLVVSVSLFLVYNYLSPNRDIKSTPLTEVSPSLVNGVDDLGEGNYKAALSSFHEYPAQGPLNDYVSFLIAETNFKMGNHQDALYRLSNVGTGEKAIVLPVEKYLLMAQIYFEQERNDKGWETANLGYQHATTDEEKGEFLELQLQIAKKQSNYSTAFEKGIKLVHTLELRYIANKRDWLFSKLAELEQKLNPNKLEDFAPLFEYSDLLSRFHKYQQSRRILVQYLGKWPERLQQDVYFEIGYLCGFKLNRPTEALVSFNRALRQSFSEALLAKVLYYKAKVQNRATEDFPLTNRLLEISKQFPKTYFGKLALHDVMKRLTAEATPTKTEKILDRYQDRLTASTVKQLTWKLFYQTFADGNYMASESLLRSLESYYPVRSPVIQYYRYKLGVASERHSTEYIKLLHSVKENPFNYYSLLAIDNGWTRGTFSFFDIWSDKHFELAEFETSLITPDLKQKTKNSFTTAIRLKNHGLMKAAIARLARVQKSLNKENYLTLKYTWEKLRKNYRKSMKASTNLLFHYYDSNEKPPLFIVKGAYPKYYRNEVEKYSAEFGVPPSLMFGLIRQESAFNKHAYGLSSERGLTQVMPGTGMGIASDLNLTDFQVNDLFNPDTSIRMGSYYVSKQLNRRNNFRLALAAYNGGFGNLRKWENFYKTDDIDLFCEQIPLTTTKNYVRGVYRNYSVYEKLTRLTNQ